MLVRERVRSRSKRLEELFDDAEVVVGRQRGSLVGLLVGADDVVGLDRGQLLVEAVVLELRPDLPVVDEGDDRVGVLELLERLLDAVGDLLAVDRVLEGLRRGGPEVAQVRREQTVRADFEAISL